MLKALYVFVNKDNDHQSDQTFCPELGCPHVLKANIQGHENIRKLIGIRNMVEIFIGHYRDNYPQNGSPEYLPITISKVTKL